MKPNELASLPLFAGLSPEQLARLAHLFGSFSFTAGTQIFEAGDRASKLYILQSGEVAILYRPYDGGSIDLATIQPGGAFGWSAAFRRASYTSAAACRTDVVTLAIEAADLHRIMRDDPQLANILLERTAQMAGSRFDSLGRQAIRRLNPKRRRK